MLNFVWNYMVIPHSPSIFQMMNQEKILIMFIFLTCSVTDLYSHGKQVDYSEDLEHLVTDILTEILGELNCVAIISDSTHQDIFGGHLFKKLATVPYYKVFICSL